MAPIDGLRSRNWLIAVSAALCLALVWGGMQASAQATQHHPFIELLKLISAFLIGLVITAVHGRRTHSEAPLGVSMQHAQILLAVSGALMMIIIGDSLARAFGIAGAASIIRFRTPVEDPRDTIILFLLLGLGMSCGLGAFAVAGLGTAFLSVALLLLDRFQVKKPRAMNLAICADGANFPTAHVQDVFSRHGIRYETREISHGNEAGVKYRVHLDETVSLENLSEELRNSDAAGIKAVVWEKAKKR
jgi:hypothetical protein